MSLHSSQLESLVGAISCEIVDQTGNYRKVHLRDAGGISRTYAVVQFNEIMDESIREAHTKIINGGLLGKTLKQARLEYEKVCHGTFELSLPSWLRREFHTEEIIGLAIYSSIQLTHSSVSAGQKSYAQILEIVPPGLKQHFTGNAPKLNNPGTGLQELCTFGEIKLDCQK